ncbi:MAG: ABC transporter permease subunit [Chloroflexi bacterium]|nr:ABC transporter permease subunit [Chloroflexota bacterium]
MSTRRRTSPLAWLWLIVAAIYLILPLIAMAWASVTTPRGFTIQAYTEVLAAPAFSQTFLFSLRAALFTIIISVLLVVPTAFWVQLRLPRWRPVIEFLTIVPLVIPPLLLAFGLIRFFNGTPLTDSSPGLFTMMLGAYVVFSFPYMYRSVDAGLQALNIRLLTEAAQSLGAGWGTILRRVIFPNLLLSVLNGSFITLSIVLGEYTIASILSQPAFSPYMLDLSTREADQATALGIISFALTWVSILVIQIVGRGRGNLGSAAAH